MCVCPSRPLLLALEPRVFKGLDTRIRLDKFSLILCDVSSNVSLDVTYCPAPPPTCVRALGERVNDDQLGVGGGEVVVSVIVIVWPPTPS